MTKARTNTPTEVPGIPKPPAEATPAMRRYLESLAEAVEIRLGRRGDARDRAITVRELLDSGLAEELRGNPYVIGPPTSSPSDPDPVGPTPTAPTSFTATGGYSLISLFWDYPNYAGHALTEIWRGTTNVIGDAQLVGVSSGISFVDPVGQSKSYYYWARHVNLDAVQGPFNSANGTLATTASDVQTLLTVLTNSITESQLYQDLGARINLIDASASVTNSVAWRINALTNAIAYNAATTYKKGDLVTYNGSMYEAKSTTTGNLPTNTTFWLLLGTFTNLGDIVNKNGSKITEINTISASSSSAAAQAIVALESTVNNPTTGVAASASALTVLNTEVFPNGTASASRIDTLSTSVDNNTASIQTNTSSINGLQVKYTVKIDNNGHVSGFGLASETNNGATTSAFIIRADKFAIVDPVSTANNLTNTPSADVIPFIVITTPQTINGVLVPVGVYIKDAFIQNGSITNVKIGNAAIDDAKIANLSADKINAGSLDAARVSIDGVTLDTVWNPALGRNVLRIKDLSISNNLIAANAAIDGAKINSLSVNKLTGDITRFMTGFAVGSGTLPTSSTTILTTQLPASTHPEGHKPYVQINVQDQAYGVTLVYVELWSAPVGTGQSVPPLSLGAPTHQLYWYEYDWLTGTQYQIGWRLIYDGAPGDVQVGDTITADTSTSGPVASVYYNGFQTHIFVENGSDPLGSTYTRTRATLGNGVVGNYTLLASTFYDANDMIGVSLFAPESQTTLGRSYQVRLKAQIANRVSIKRVDLLAMGIR